MSHALRVGVADQIGYFRAYNTDGSAKTDLTSSTTGLALSVFRVGAAAVSISSLSAKAADNTAHADGAIRAVSGNLYTVDLPDAACADQVPSISVKGSYTGGVIEGPEHPLVGYNPASVAVGANTTTPPTSAQNADAVWDEARSGHTTPGTFGEKVKAELDSASRLAIWNTLTTESFAADSFGDLLIISDGTNGREVKVTGAKHIAADVHEVQPDGLSASTEITAINTFATRVTTGLVADGPVWQFTANMLELGPSGSSVVTVLPATGIVADRSAGVTLTPVVGETISQAITLYRTDGTTAVNVSGKTLKIIFETMTGADVAVVENADITVSGTNSNVVTFAYPSAVTASERSLRFALRDAAAPLTMYLQGICSVVAAPKVDA